MNKKILSALMGAAAIGFSTYGVNTMAASQTGNAAADIVAAITITEATTMNFGDISTGGSSGTVVLGTSDSITAVTGGQLSQGGTITSADFALLGTSGANYLVSFTAGSVTDSGGGGGAAMAVNTFTYTSVNSGATCSPCVMTGGGDTLTVGATLDVGATQAASTYTGTYGVTILYQ